MEKLKKYSVKQVSRHSGILFTTMLAINLILSLMKFYKSIYHTELLKRFLVYDALNSLLFFLPAFLITSLIYTISVSFSDDEIKHYKVKEVIFFFIEYSLVYIFIIFILIGLLNSILMNQNDSFKLTDKHLKIQESSRVIITKLTKESERAIHNRKYYDALEKLNEILLIIPEYAPAYEKIELITDELNKQRTTKLTNLKNTGIRLFHNKMYKRALENFNEYLKMKSADSEIRKYRNRTVLEIDFAHRNIVKDKYNHQIAINPYDESLLEYNRKLHSLIKKGKTAISDNQFLRAKSYFKQALQIDTYNYDAFHYLKEANNKINRIIFYTNTSDKLVKTNLIYKNDEYEIFFKELRKAGDNSYIFYNTTFLNRKTKLKKTWKYGYCDNKDGVYKFCNDLIRDKKIFNISDLNPSLIWNYYDIIASPEKFSFFSIFEFRKYCYDNLNDPKLFFCVLIKKINYYILILFLLINLLFLFFFIRKKIKGKHSNIYDYIFLPVTAIVLYNAIIYLFELLNTFLTIGAKYKYMTLAMNLSYYILLYIIFFILFNIFDKKLPVKVEEKQEESEKKEEKNEEKVDNENNEPSPQGEIVEKS